MSMGELNIVVSSLNNSIAYGYHCLANIPNAIKIQCNTVLISIIPHTLCGFTEFKTIKHVATMATKNATTMPKVNHCPHNYTLNVNNLIEMLLRECLMVAWQ